MNRKAILLTVLLLVGFSGCALHPPTAEKLAGPVGRLRTELDAVLADPAFANAYWGVEIQSIKNGQYLYRRNVHKSFRPASNLKLFTTGTALVKLGPDFTYTTRVFRTGPVENGVLRGDLVIQGSGDPTISGRFHNGNMLTVFQEWADSLQARGITHIAGRIVGDDNAFADEIMGEGWAWDYQSDWYAAQISALSFNDNCVDILYTPGKAVGDTVTFRLEPPTHYVHVINKVVTAPKHQAKGVFFHRERGKNRVVITGSIEIGSPEKRDWFSVENPTLYAATVFREVLTSRGITVDGPAVDIDSLKNFTYLTTDSLCVARYKSPDLIQIVRAVNKVSQNLYAELLLRTLGKVFRNEGSAHGGIAVVKEFLAGIGIDTTRVAMFDGSGLSHLDMITPDEMVTLLRFLYRSSVSDDFLNSLPIAGVDGSLKNRMKGTAAEANVRAKTGYISNTRSLSGFVTTHDGELLVFSILVNNYLVPTSRANGIQDWICERLANFSRARK